MKDELICRIKDCEIGIRFGRATGGVMLYANGMIVWRCVEICNDIILLEFPRTTNEFDVKVIPPLKLKPDIDDRPFDYIYSGVNLNIYSCYSTKEGDDE